VGGAVAVVLVGVLVAALGAKEQGRQHKQAAAANQDFGKSEAIGVHRRSAKSHDILPGVCQQGWDKIEIISNSGSLKQKPGPMRRTFKHLVKTRIPT